MDAGELLVVDEPFDKWADQFFGQGNRFEDHWEESLTTFPRLRPGTRRSPLSEDFAHSLGRWLACSGRNLLGPGLKGFVQSKLWTRSWLPGEMMRVSTRTFLLCFIGVDLVPNAD